MTLKRQLLIVRSWLWLAVLCAALAGGAAFLVSRQLPAVYSSDATLLVGPSLSNANLDYSEILVSQSLAQTYADIAHTRPVLERVVAKLNLSQAPGDLAGNVAARVLAGSSLVVVTASANSPDRAALIANALAAELLASVPTVQGPQAAIQLAIQQDLQETQDLITATAATIKTLAAIPSRTVEQDRQLQAAQDQLVSLRSTRASLLTSVSAVPVNTLAVIEPAVPSSDPVSPRTLFNSALGIAIGLAMAAVIAFLVENLRSSSSGDGVGISDARARG